MDRAAQTLAVLLLEALELVDVGGQRVARLHEPRDVLFEARLLGVGDAPCRCLGVGDELLGPRLGVGDDL